MSDIFGLSDFTALTESGAASTGSTLSTGDIRRAYNFGNDLYRIGIKRDPFYTLMQKLGKKNTDDTQFKFAEFRPSFHKRYAYVTGHGTTAAASETTAGLDSTTQTSGNTYYFKFGTDYKVSAGNIGSVYGNSSSEVSIGDEETKPSFIIPGVVIKVNTTSTTGGSTSTNKKPSDYLLAKVESTTDSGYYVIAKCTIVRANSSSYSECMSFYDDAALSDTYDKSIYEQLEPMRCYIVGSAHAQGSGFPGTWGDNPFSTGYGLTQIFKTTLSMDNSTRATVMKYDKDEFKRLYEGKLLEHKWDIENAMWFSSQGAVDGINYTQGVVDYVLNYGNLFSLTYDTKNLDTFGDDLSQLYDPRYNNEEGTLFFADTKTWRWLHQISGLFQNTVEISTNLRASLDLTSKTNLFGLDISKFDTDAGTIKVVKDIHLDSSPVKMVALNLKNVKYRPLVGNGINRDTHAYLGVQTIENSGIDARTDLIQTEVGMEFKRPESFAIWT